MFNFPSPARNKRILSRQNAATASVINTCNWCRTILVHENNMFIRTWISTERNSSEKSTILNWLENSGNQPEEIFCYVIRTWFMKPRLPTLGKEVQFAQSVSQSAERMEINETHPERASPRIPRLLQDCREEVCCLLKIPWMGVLGSWWRRLKPGKWVLLVLQWNFAGDQLPPALTWRNIEMM